MISLYDALYKTAEFMRDNLIDTISSNVSDDLYSVLEKGLYAYLDDGMDGDLSAMLMDSLDD